MMFSDANKTLKSVLQNKIKSFTTTIKMNNSWLNLGFRGRVETKKHEMHVESCELEIMVCPNRYKAKCLKKRWMIIKNSLSNLVCNKQPQKQCQPDLFRFRRGLNELWQTKRKLFELIIKIPNKISGQVISPQIHNSFFGKLWQRIYIIFLISSLISELKLRQVLCSYGSNDRVYGAFFRSCFCFRLETAISQQNIFIFSHEIDVIVKLSICSKTVNEQQSSV